MEAMPSSRPRAICARCSGTSRLETSIGGMGGKGGGTKARVASPPKVVVSYRPRRLWRLG